MQRAYKGAVGYFLLFSILLISSSVMIFATKIGLSAEGVLNYYKGNEELFIPAKSISGILKIVLPHIFVFGLLAMVLLHFVVFTKSKQKVKLLAILFLLTASIEMFSPILILLDYDVFAYVKLYSFFVFEILLVYLLYLLFFSIVQE